MVCASGLLTSVTHQYLWITHNVCATNLVNLVLFLLFLLLRDMLKKVNSLTWRLAIVQLRRWWRWGW